MHWRRLQHLCWQQFIILGGLFIRPRLGLSTCCGSVLTAQVATSSSSRCIWLGRLTWLALQVCSLRSGLSSEHAGGDMVVLAMLVVYFDLLGSTRASTSGFWLLHRRCDSHSCGCRGNARSSHLASPQRSAAPPQLCGGGLCGPTWFCRLHHRLCAHGQRCLWS